MPLHFGRLGQRYALPFPRPACRHISVHALSPAPPLTAPPHPPHRHACDRRMTACASPSGPDLPSGGNPQLLVEPHTLVGESSAQAGGRAEFSSGGR